MDKLNPDRLFPADPTTRAIARNLYQLVKDLPIISPHGHTDPKWFADNVPFADPASLLLTPDHYVFRMLYSQGIKLEEFGVARVDGGVTERDSRKIWRLFASHYYLFRGTPTRMWFDWVLSSMFDAPIPLTPENADATYDRIAERLQKPEFRPRALFERFNIEALATTESPLDDLHASRHHPQERLARPRDHGLPARQRRRSGLAGFSRQPEEIQRAHRRRRALVARLYRRASQAPRVLRGHGRHFHRSRPSDGAHRGPESGRCRGAVHAHRARRCAIRATRNCSAARCSPRWRA